MSDAITRLTRPQLHAAYGQARGMPPPLTIGHPWVVSDLREGSEFW